MKTIIIAILLAICTATAAFADTTPSITVAAAPATGWGPSAILNMSQFFLNGNYSLLSGGVGGGVSYKWAENGFVNEAGFYLGPQSGQSGGVTVTTVSGIAYLDLYKAFGVGIGYQFWKSGVGVQKPDGSTAFFSVGYNLTN